MTAPAARPAPMRVQLAVNTPQPFTLRFVDVYPNAPDKDPKGVGFGASVKLKGTVDGADAVCYPKGRAWAAIKALVASGAVAPGDYSDDPAEQYSIPVVERDVVLCMAQPAGERWANLTVTRAGAQATTSAPAATRQAPPTASTSTKQPMSIGAYIPAIDGPADPYARNDVPASQAVTPPMNGDAVKRLWLDCLAFVVAEAVPMIQSADVGVTDVGVLAGTATLFIERARRGEGR